MYPKRRVAGQSHISSVGFSTEHDVYFNELQHAEHHVSSLADTSLGIVTNFPLHFMHLVCLGVIRRLIWLWIKGPVANYSGIGRHMVSAISDNLLKFHSFLPREFGRKCRPLSEWERWKATECRQFLLLCYGGMLSSFRDEIFYLG